MLDFELQELGETSKWRDVLAAYLAAHQSAQASEAEFDGWMPRIMSIEGVADEELPRIHGKLIAWGFLKFQLASRGTGVVYQISSAGRQALEDLPGDEVSAGEDVSNGDVVSADDEEAAENAHRPENETTEQAA